MHPSPTINNAQPVNCYAAGNPTECPAERRAFARGVLIFSPYCAHKLPLWFTTFRDRQRCQKTNPLHSEMTKETLACHEKPPGHLPSHWKARLTLCHQTGWCTSPLWLQRHQALRPAVQMMDKGHQVDRAFLWGSVREDRLSQTHFLNRTKIRWFVLHSSGEETNR